MAAWTCRSFPSSAIRLVLQATGLGFETMLIDRIGDAPNFWLWAQFPSGETVQSGDVRGGIEQILRTETVSCELPPA